MIAGFYNIGSKKEKSMAWTCPRCKSTENLDSTIRCVCGYEDDTQEVIDYDRLGGALYLVLAGLVLTPLINLLLLSKRIEIGLSALPMELFFEALSFMFYVVIPVFMIFLFIKRKKILRPIIISYLFLNLLSSLFVYCAIKSLPSPERTAEALMDAKSGVLVAIIGCGIWVTYFLKSERAKKTLTR